MSSRAVVDRSAVLAALDAFDTACQALTRLEFSAFTTAELLELQSRREHGTRITAGVDHRILAALQAQASPAEIGGKSWTDVLALRLRISRADATARIKQAEHLGPRHTIGGDVLPPLLPRTAAALADGKLTGEHADIVRNTLRKAEKYTSPSQRPQIESSLVQIAVSNPPETLTGAATELLYLLNQDGDGPNIPEHTPGIRLGAQDADGNTRITGWLDPETTAYWKTIESVWGAPGINNPADAAPIPNPTPNPLESPSDDTQAAQQELDASQDQTEAAARDTRPPCRRNHDAFKTLCRDLIMSKKLGQHAGLPVTVVVSTTLDQLEQGAGIARTNSGVKLSFPELIRLATHAHHYLLVYRKHTAQPLYLGKTKRLATPAQRLVLAARDRGCTRPGCFTPADHCQAHHGNTDWIHGGHTNADTLTLACGPDNRLASHGWTTTIGENGRAQWTPPPLINTGHDPTNHHHHPEELLYKNENDP